jgi:hypothetical protein
MKELHRPSLSLARGVCAAILCALGGVFSAVALALGITACRWLITGARELIRRMDLQYLQEDMVLPFIGCAIISGCAGFAAFAPEGRHRLAWPFAVVFLVSVPLWFFVGLLELPPHIKSQQHPGLYPLEMVVFLGPPIAAAAVLTWIRIRGASAWRGLTPRHPPWSGNGTLPDLSRIDCRKRSQQPPKAPADAITRADDSVAEHPDWPRG